MASRSAQCGFALVTGFMTILLSLAGCSPNSKPTNTVVVYTSVDDVFARPICEHFQKQTGIEVKLVPDTEETKSAGLLNRLIAEKDRPVADVFWSGDPVRAAVLKARGVSTPFKPANPADVTGRFSDHDGYWTALSARARVILVNTNLVPVSETPRSIQAFVDPKWRGKACLANPLFGTTSMHAAALFETMGDANAKEFFHGLSSNGVKMLSSNGEVKRRVASGEFAFGLADTDDANEARHDGKPVIAVYPDQSGTGTLLVPNAAVMIARSPNPANAAKFIHYLLTADTEKALAESEAAQMPLRPGVPVPPEGKRVDEIKTMDVDYQKLGARLDELSRGFLKDWASRN